MCYNSPPEDAIENALNSLQSAEEALQNAIEALLRIGVNLKILGWYSTLEALQSGVTNPSPGDIYGVGDPTVLYVWTGSAWTQLPGVFVQSSGYNPQLLDNAYFVGGGSQQGGGQLPVNQKRQDSYTASQNTVSVIDRFKLSNSGTLSLTPGGVELYGYNDPDSENRVYCNFEQIVDSGIYNSLLKRQITASVLGSGNFSLVLGVNGTYPIRKNYNSETIGLTTVTYTLPQSITEITVVVQLQNSSPGTATILAEKLELGTHSTLAHLVNGKWILNDSPPNFQQELAKCQRYQNQLFYNSLSPCLPYAFGTSETTAEIIISLSVPLRITPSVSMSNLTLAEVNSGNVKYPITGYNIARFNDNFVKINFQISGGGIVIGKAYGFSTLENETASLLLDANL